MTSVSKKIKQRLVQLHYDKQAIHLGSALSCLDLLSVLILDMKVHYKDVLLSKGHAASALYVILNEAGVITDEILETYYQEGTQLTAHPDFKSGLVNFSTGSLGHAPSLACGMAQARKLQGNLEPIFCVLSDGELNEGSVYEAINYAVFNHLNNIRFIVDHNGFQGLGALNVVQGDLINRFKNISGLDFLEVDGHDQESLKSTFSYNSINPVFIDARTIKGKGLDFAENNNAWHYQKLSKTDYETAINQIL